MLTFKSIDGGNWSAHFFLGHLVLLQANVMLEYDIDEAQTLLEKNLGTASRNLESLEEDLDFLRDQFTTTEVSILIQLCLLPG